MSLVVLCLATSACQDQSGERVEELGPKIHRLTVDLAGDEPAEARLARSAAAVCPGGYDRQNEEEMPSDSPRYRVWLVRCR
jgi:hypothetical protein